MTWRVLWPPANAACPESGAGNEDDAINARIDISLDEFIEAVARGLAPSGEAVTDNSETQLIDDRCILPIGNNAGPVLLPLPIRL